MSKLNYLSIPIKAHTIVAAANENTAMDPNLFLSLHNENVNPKE